jgi:hypothetical protein
MGCGTSCVPLRNYTFRSMPRSNASHAMAAQPEEAREVVQSSRRRTARRAQRSSKRLSKRVVHKPDGRYLIYYEKI